MGVRFEGMNELFKSLDGIASKDKCAEAMGKCCAIVERSAKQKAPKDTGALRRSITSKVETAGRDVKGIVFTPLEYAPYREYGTGLFAEKGGRKNVPWVYVAGEGSGKKGTGKTYTLEEAKRTVAILRSKGLEAYYTYGQKPQPFMRPAIKENREKVIDTFVKGVLSK